MIQKMYFKMHSPSCINTHHDVTDLVNHGMAKNTKTWIYRERNITFLWNKKILNLCLRWHILRCYRVVAEVTFKVVMLLICLDVLGKEFFYFPERDSEGICRKLLSLVKLYQRFWIWNIDQNLNMALLIVAVCTVLLFSSLTRFSGKENPQVICNFSFQIFKMRFSRFSKCLKATWNSPEQPAQLTQK